MQRQLLARVGYTGQLRLFGVPRGEADHHQRAQEAAVSFEHRQRDGSHFRNALRPGEHEAFLLDLLQMRSR